MGLTCLDSKMYFLLLTVLLLTVSRTFLDFSFFDSGVHLKLFCFLGQVKTSVFTKVSTNTLAGKIQYHSSTGKTLQTMELT